MSLKPAWRPLHEALGCSVEYKIPTKIASETMFVEIKPKVKYMGHVSKIMQSGVGDLQPNGGQLVHLWRGQRDKKIILSGTIANE